LLLPLILLPLVSCDRAEVSLEATPTADQRAEATIAALQTDVALLSTPEATALPASPTPEPTLTPSPERTVVPTVASSEPPQIVSFAARPSPADPSGTITLTWSVRGADSVTVSWLDKNTNTVALSQLELSGSLSVELSGVKFSGGDHVEFDISADDAQGQLIFEDDGRAVARRLSVPLETELTIASFTASPDPVERGGTVTLAWDAPHAHSAGITRLSTDGSTFLTTEAFEFGEAGSIAIPVPEEYTTSVTYYLGARDANGVLRKAFVTVGIICPYDEHLAPQCPLTRGYVWAAYQPFERGHMVWRSGTGEIWVLYDDGRFETHADTWSEGQPVDVPEAPPEGLMAPVRGFGKLWAGRPEIRATLGWATAPESGYTMLVESMRGGSGRYPGRSHYFLLPDDRVVHLYGFTSSWEILE
jgi:hypothetical protein